MKDNMAEGLLQEPRRSQPGFVLAHADAGYRARAASYLWRLGLDFASVGSAQDLHEIAQAVTLPLVVLDTDLPDESGYLTCAKIKRSRPDCRVLLLGHPAASENYRLAQFVGAEVLLDRHAMLPLLGDRILRGDVATKV
jgi:DNA-binding response OmpR family regulator